MKRILLLALWGLIGIPCLHAQVTAAEYFFDNDPGAGNGSPITLNSGATINFTKSISIASLQPGFHLIGIRTKENGSWGLFESRGFYITKAIMNVPNIVAAEYYIDVDPGVGKALPINITPGSETTFQTALPLPSIPKGFHYVAIRTKGADGQWGLAEVKGFYISELATDMPDIVAAEYYFDTDPGVGNGIAIHLPFPFSTHADSLVLPLDTLPLGNHQIAIRVQNADGAWSLLENRSFNICTNYGALSSFNFQIEGKQVFFTNTSVYNDSTRWEFGDGTFSGVLNPIKTYNPGVYPVRLISVNECAIDTASITLIIKGMQNINATVAGNNGVATIIYEGVGFTTNTDIKVVRNGVAFLPVKKQFINETRMHATYDFRGIETGLYNAVAVLGSAFDTLKNALIIEQDIPVYVTPSLQGPSVFRTNRFGRELFLQNTGSNDAVLVPVFASVPYYPNISPGTFNVNFNTSSSGKKIALDGFGIFQKTLAFLNNNAIALSVMDENVRDTVHKKHTIAFYQIKIPGHQSAQHHFNASNPGIVASHPMLARVYNPLLSSAAAIDSIETTYLTCYSSFLKHEIQKQLKIALPDAGWNQAFEVAFDTLMKTLHTISQLPVESSSIVSMPSVFSALLAEMVSQPGSGVPANLTPIQFRLIIEGVINNWAMLDDIASIGVGCIDPAFQFITGTQTFDAAPGGLNATIKLKASKTLNAGCDEYDPDSDPFGGVSFGAGTRNAANINYNVPGTPDTKDGCSSTSVDPNTKTGPGNNTDRLYINHGDAIGYTIQFENLASASSPAAYVEVNDTLDTDLFDLTSLEMTGLGWGDSAVVFEPNKKQLSFLKDLRPAMPNYLRADITTNISSGAIQWKFYTVDTINYQLTGDPFEGFLPPNTNGIIGQGYVSFTIKPKAGFVSGTTYNNKATIIFDENAAIITDVWQHKIDTTLPSSNVQSLPATVPNPSFQVNWNGTDAHSGIEKYSIFVSINDSAFTKWKDLVTETSAMYEGAFGKTYKFFSVAIDKAGNSEYPPSDPMASPDAVTTLLATGMVISIKNGNWNDPATWSNNQVPNAESNAIIRHNVIINIDATCKTLKAESPAQVQVAAGKKLTVLE
jgi:hypothetical protein